MTQSPSPGQRASDHLRALQRAATDDHPLAPRGAIRAVLAAEWPLLTYALTCTADDGEALRRWAQSAHDRMSELHGGTASP